MGQLQGRTDEDYVKRGAVITSVEQGEFPHKTRGVSRLYGGLSHFLVLTHTSPSTGSPPPLATSQSLTPSLCPVSRSLLDTTMSTTYTSFLPLSSPLSECLPYSGTPLRLYVCTYVYTKEFEGRPKVVVLDFNDGDYLLFKFEG